MPHYYFSVMGKADQEGTELPSPLYARREGTKLLGALLAEEDIVPRHGEPCVTVTDETGAMIFELGVIAFDLFDKRAA